MLRKLLYADHHPTLTRFFTFRTSEDAMLTMMFLDFPEAGLKIKTTAREENQRRLTKVTRIFQKPTGAMPLAAPGRSTLTSFKHVCI